LSGATQTAPLTEPFFPCCPAPPCTQYTVRQIIGIASELVKRNRMGEFLAARDKSRAARGLLGLLSTDERAFEEVFVAAFELLDVEWLKAKASYMSFNVPMTVRGGGGGGGACTCVRARLRAPRKKEAC
jgi:hypothetical protein